MENESIQEELQNNEENVFEIEYYPTAEDSYNNALCCTIAYEFFEKSKGDIVTSKFGMQEEIEESMLQCIEVMRSIVSTLHDTYIVKDEE